MKFPDQNYSPSEVTHIIDAYKRLFPSTEGTLADYWDYKRTRPWSYLTTDFHTVSIEQIQSLDTVARTIDSIGLTDKVLGERFRETSQKYGVGYSLGITPCTDDLLLRSFSVKTDRVVIFLGHDWYPIVTRYRGRGELYTPFPPLRRQSIYYEPAYKDAIPENLLKTPDCAILFMNLYPDFRAPGSDKVGTLGDYTEWINGFKAVCQSISKHFYLSGVISWGQHVWQALRKNLEEEWRRLEIMAAVARQHERGAPLNLRLDELTVPFYAFAHPSFATNFKKSSHWAAYRNACSILASNQNKAYKKWSPIKSHLSKKTSP